VFDLPDAPRPDADAPAPVRFLYDFDNLLLSHADRSRVITPAYFHQGFTADGPMPCLLLVDGFTGGTWKLTRQRREATLTVQPFARLAPATEDEVAAEGARLLAFLAPEAAPRAVRIVEPRSGA
jgi:Winged helix DNA-binding domain